MNMNREQILDHVRHWQESGLSRRAYCRKHGVDYHRLCYHARRMTRKDDRATSEFAPITGTAEARVLRIFGGFQNHGLRVCLDGRVEVHVPADCPVTYLASLCGELERC